MQFFKEFNFDKLLVYNVLHVLHCQQVTADHV